MSESSGPFDLIFGLPVHVLVTHAVVVLVPFAVLALVLAITVPRLRTRYRMPAVALAVLGAISAVIAEQSGEALEARVGSPGQHAEWGEMLPPVAIALAVLSVIWLIVSGMASSRGKVIATLVGVLVVVVGIAAVVITVLTGHSGAERTWSDRVSEDSGVVETPADQPVAEGEAMPVEPDGGTGATAPDVLSIETVALNATEDSCWAIINDNVYDLTEWISQHPGGSSRILSLCGTDGTSRFEGQHRGQGSAESTLESYLIGALGDPLP